MVCCKLFTAEEIEEKYRDKKHFGSSAHMYILMNFLIHVLNAVLIELIHVSKWGLGFVFTPINSLNQWWNIVIWRKKFQWNFNRNLYIFIQENAFENVVGKMAAILSRPQYVKPKQIPCFRYGFIINVIRNFIRAYLTINLTPIYAIASIIPWFNCVLLNWILKLDNIWECRFHFPILGSNFAICKTSWVWYQLFVLINLISTDSNPMCMVVSWGKLNIVVYPIYLKESIWDGLSQWDKTLLCNNFSHWRSP